jgi:hypothetical protein
MGYGHRTGIGCAGGSSGDGPAAAVEAAVQEKAASHAAGSAVPRPAE